MPGRGSGQAALLLVVDEETAFWCLAMVVEKILPGHFNPNMAMALVDQGVLRDLWDREDRQLMLHFDELQVAPSLVSTQWLLTCFVGSAMPLCTLLRVWDCMFYEGHISILFRLCCALTRQHRDRLLDTDNAADAYKALLCIGAQLTDADALLDAAYSLQWDALMQPKQLATLRKASMRRMTLEQVCSQPLRCSRYSLKSRCAPRFGRIAACPGFAASGTWGRPGGGGGCRRRCRCRGWQRS